MNKYIGIVALFVLSLLPIGAVAVCTVKAESETALSYQEMNNSVSSVNWLPQPESASGPATGTWVYALIFIGIGITLASLALTIALRHRHKQNRQFSISEA